MRFLQPLKNAGRKTGIFEAIVVGGLLMGGCRRCKKVRSELFTPPFFGEKTAKNGKIHKKPLKNRTGYTIMKRYVLLKKQWRQK